MNFWRKQNFKMILCLSYLDFLISALLLACMPQINKCLHFLNCDYLVILSGSIHFLFLLKFIFSLFIFDHYKVLFQALIFFIFELELIFQFVKFIFNSTTICLYFHSNYFYSNIITRFSQDYKMYINAFVSYQFFCIAHKSFWKDCHTRLNIFHI